jgi:hypothetical protein
MNPTRLRPRDADFEQAPAIGVPQRTVGTRCFTGNLSFSTSKR